MINFDLTYLLIGVTNFVVISLYMIEHENAGRLHKGMPKKPHAQHFDGMFFVVFSFAIVLFAYFSIVPAIYCALRLVKGWLGFSLLSQGDKRKLDAEMMVERRRHAINALLKGLPFSGGIEEGGSIPTNASYPQAMAYVAIWLADSQKDKASLNDRIESCKSYWLTLRYTASNEGSDLEHARVARLASSLPEQVDDYCRFLDSQSADDLQYWPNIERYVADNLQ